MKDELRIEIDKLFEKHGVKKAIVLLEGKDLYRVLAIGGEEDGECQYAHLFEGCVNVSEGLRGILTHVTHHSTQRMAQMAGESTKNEDRIIN